MKKKGIKHAHHVFSEGWHGLSVSNEDWAAGNHGEPYSAEQSFALVKAMKEGLIEEPENGADSLLDFLKPLPEGIKIDPVAEVSIWPDLADGFLKSLK